MNVNAEIKKAALHLLNNHENNLSIREFYTCYEIAKLVKTGLLSKDAVVDVLIRVSKPFTKMLKERLMELGVRESDAYIVTVSHSFVLIYPIILGNYQDINESEVISEIRKEWLQYIIDNL